MSMKRFSEQSRGGKRADVGTRLIASHEVGSGSNWRGGPCAPFGRDESRPYGLHPISFLLDHGAAHLDDLVA
jgi:hypothetical protein